MKTIRFLNVVVAVLLATVILTSCGSKKEVTLTVDKVDISLKLTHLFHYKLTTQSSSPDFMFWDA